MTKIGFIGLGIMGRPMLRNLRKAGHELVALRYCSRAGRAGAQRPRRARLVVP